MVVGSGLLGGAVLVKQGGSSGSFDAEVTILGQSNTNFDAELAVTKTSNVAEFDAKLCVEIEATKISPSALIVTPTIINSSGLPPFTAIYSASGFASGSKDIIKYTWFFNDIETAVSGGQSVEYTYTSSGQFTVVLRVTDTDGFVGYDSRRISTHSGVVLDLPQLEISGIPSGGTAPLSVDFEAVSTPFAGGTIVGHSWSFGHGKFSTRQLQSGVVYNTPGHFIPVCTIVDDRNVRMSDDLDIGVNN